LPRTLRLIEAELEAGLWMKGAQVCVMIGGEARHVAVGDTGTGDDVTEDTVFKVYCAIKPITAVAIAKLVDEGVVDLDEPLRHRLPEYRSLQIHDISIRHLLAHTAGLHAVSTVDLEVRPEAQRQALLERTQPPAGWRVGIDAGYGEFFGWHLLGRALETVSGQPLREHLRDSVLDPLGLDSTWIGMTPKEYDANYERLGVSWRLRGHVSSPMLLELSERWCCEVNCASGGYTRAADLARFYSALATQLRGGGETTLPSRPTLATFCSSARARGYDVVLRRECEYGLGFMVELSEHFYGDACSSAAVGHSGLAGSSFAFADPAHDLGAAVILNGIIEGEASLLRREALVQTLYDDLGLRVTAGAP
jgi:CubicO group peptidase (beta-lactamase class C family)